MKKFHMKVWPAALLVCFSFHAGFSQKDAMKFGEISIEDLAMISYTHDSSASAVILEDFGKIYPEDGLSMIFERHVRIKILKTEGAQWADQTIQLAVAGTAGENRFQFKASTFNLVNGIVEETALPKESMFREKFTRGIELQKFTFQNVKPGSVLEYSFSMRAPGMPDWQFQKTIPTRRSELWTIMPSDLLFKHLSHGYIAATTYEAKESSATNSHHWIYRNVPAFKAEPFMSSEQDFIGRLEFYLTGASAGIRLRLFGSEVQSMESWQQVNEIFLNSPYIGDQISGNMFLKSIAKELIEGKEEPIEQVSAIYDYVKKKYSWQPGSTLGSFRFKEAFDKGMGSSADINLSLASMLEKIGFKVNAVFISTRDNGMVRKLVPMPYQFNYIICAVQVDNRIILLDATEKYLPLGYLPERCLNGDGFLLDKDQYAWIPTDFFPISKTVTSGEVKLEGNGSIAGKITLTHYGYDALNFRKSYLEKGEAEHTKEFLHKMGWESDQYEVQNVEDLSAPIKEAYSIQVDHAVSGTAEILYINPILTERIAENPFTADERKYPISYNKPFETVYMSRIILPEGYTIEEIPAPLVIKLQDNSARYTYSITQNSNVLSILSHFKIAKTMFIQNEYLQLKELYDQVVAKQAEQIILKKN